MNKILETNFYGQKREYEVVKDFPAGYVVWNIGRRNFKHEKFIPLAKYISKYEYRIDPNTLKALEVETEELALHVINMAHRGVEVDYNNFCDIVADFSENKK